MGSWDEYCAICGVFPKFEEVLEDQLRDHGLSSSVDDNNPSTRQEASLRFHQWIPHYLYFDFTADSTTYYNDLLAIRDIRPQHEYYARRALSGEAAQFIKLFGGLQYDNDGVLWPRDRSVPIYEELIEGEPIREPEIFPSMFVQTASVLGSYLLHRSCWELLQEYAKLRYTLIPNTSPTHFVSPVGFWLAAQTPAQDLASLRILNAGGRGPVSWINYDPDVEMMQEQFYYPLAFKPGHEDIEKNLRYMVQEERVDEDRAKVLWDAVGWWALPRADKFPIQLAFESADKKTFEFTKFISPTSAHASSSKHPESSLLRLPPEILLQIACQLPYRSIIDLTATSRRVRDVVVHNIDWLAMQAFRVAWFSPTHELSFALPRRKEEIKSWIECADNCLRRFNTRNDVGERTTSVQVKAMVSSSNDGLFTRAAGFPWYDYLRWSVNTSAESWSMRNRRRIWGILGQIISVVEERDLLQKWSVSNLCDP